MFWSKARLFLNWSARLTENEVGLETVELLAQQIEVVEDGEVLDSVLQRTEGGEDVTSVFQSSVFNSALRS